MTLQQTTNMFCSVHYTENTSVLHVSCDNERAFFSFDLAVNAINQLYITSCSVGKARLFLLVGLRTLLL